MIPPKSEKREQGDDSLGKKNNSEFWGGKIVTIPKREKGLGL